MNSTLAYFVEQGCMSDRGTHISLYENLPMVSLFWNAAPSKSR